jgi:hypothetical protein
MKRWTSLVLHITGMIILGTLFTWLVNALACYHGWWNLCGGDTYLFLAGLVAVALVAPLAYIYLNPLASIDQAGPE